MPNDLYPSGAGAPEESGEPFAAPAPTGATTTGTTPGAIEAGEVGPTFLTIRPTMPTAYAEPYAPPPTAVPTTPTGFVITGGTIVFTTASTATFHVTVADGRLLGGTLASPYITGGLLPVGTTILVTGGTLRLNTPTSGTVILITGTGARITGGFVTTGAAGPTVAGAPSPILPFFPPLAPGGPVVTGPMVTGVAGAPPIYPFFPAMPGGGVLLDPNNPAVAVTGPGVMLVLFQEEPGTKPLEDLGTRIIKILKDWYSSQDPEVVPPGTLDWIIGQVRLFLKYLTAATDPQTQTYVFNSLSTIFGAYAACADPASIPEVQFLALKLTEVVPAFRGPPSVSVPTAVAFIVAFVNGVPKDAAGAVAEEFQAAHDAVAGGGTPGAGTDSPETPGTGPGTGGVGSEPPSPGAQAGTGGSAPPTPPVIPPEPPFPPHPSAWQMMTNPSVVDEWWDEYRLWQYKHGEWAAARDAAMAAYQKQLDAWKAQQGR